MKELLSPEKLRATGLFLPDAVNRLAGKIEQGGPVGETNDMALVGIISTQLLHHLFVAAFDMPRPLSEQEVVRVCFGPNMPTPKDHYAIQQECTRD